VSTINHLSDRAKGVDVGQLIMLGALFGLIAVIFGLVLCFDPESRGGTTEERDR
jgi:hypothetical protein